MTSSAGGRMTEGCLLLSERISCETFWRLTALTSCAEPTRYHMGLFACLRACLLACVLVCLLACLFVCFVCFVFGLFIGVFCLLVCWFVCLVFFSSSAERSKISLSLTHCHVFSNTWACQFNSSAFAIQRGPACPLFCFVLAGVALKYCYSVQQT